MWGEKQHLVGGGLNVLAGRPRKTPRWAPMSGPKGAAGRRRGGEGEKEPQRRQFQSIERAEKDTGQTLGLV